MQWVKTNQEAKIRKVWVVQSQPFMFIMTLKKRLLFERARGRRGTAPLF